MPLILTEGMLPMGGLHSSPYGPLQDTRACLFLGHGSHFSPPGVIPENMVEVTVGLLI